MLGAVNQVARAVLWKPASAVRSMFGKKAARATPISALAAAARRSAAAMSGRRCSRAEGTPVGTLGRVSGAVDAASEKLEAGSPTRLAMACS